MQESLIADNIYPKLVVTHNGVFVTEYVMHKEKVRIGRKLNNELQLSELSVSSNHSIISISEEGSSIKDLDSINGTIVNGIPINNCELSDKDIIQIGTYELCFYTATENNLPTMCIQSDHKKFDSQDNQTDFTETANIPLAAVKILTGPLKAKVLELHKPLNSIGFNGTKLALIAKNTDNYTITALNHDHDNRHSDFATLNGTRLVDECIPLHDHDIIEIKDTQIEFYYF